MSLAVMLNTFVLSSSAFAILSPLMLTAKLLFCMYVPKFNQTFGEHLPEDGIMDLKTCGDGRALLAKLNERVPLCEHCVLNPMKWHACTMPAKMEDFAV